MGRKRKRGPKRRPKKTGGVKKGTTQVSDEVKASVVQLKHAGYSGNKIARALKLPSSTVYRIISVHAITGIYCNILAIYCEILKYAIYCDMRNAHIAIIAIYESSILQYILSS